MPGKGLLTFEWSLELDSMNLRVKRKSRQVVCNVCIEHREINISAEVHTTLSMTSSFFSFLKNVDKI